MTCAPVNPSVVVPPAGFVTVTTCPVSVPYGLANWVTPPTVSVTDARCPFVLYPKLTFREVEPAVCVNDANRPPIRLTATLCVGAAAPRGVTVIVSGWPYGSSTYPVVLPLRSSASEIQQHRLVALKQRLVADVAGHRR